MNSFGEELRSQRLSRGIALDDIISVTKISRRHLVALEQDRFRLLPGGILNKGIVRGYVSACGLDQRDWTDRFMKAYSATVQVAEDDRGWTEFASNVGRSRIQQREAMELRLRWAGALLLVAAVTVAGYFTVRYLGVRAGWWNSVMPVEVGSKAHALVSQVSSWLRRA